MESLGTSKKSSSFSTTSSTALSNPYFGIDLETENRHLFRLLIIDFTDQSVLGCGGEIKICLSFPSLEKKEINDWSLHDCSFFQALSNFLAFFFSSSISFSTFYLYLRSAASVFHLLFFLRECSFSLA